MLIPWLVLTSAMALLPPEIRRWSSRLKAEVNGKGSLRPDQMEASLREILQAVDEGRSDEIEHHIGGVRVRRLKELSPQERLMENLADPEVRARLTEPSDPEEMLLMAQLRQDLRRASEKVRAEQASPASNTMDESLASVASEILADMAGSKVQVSLLEEMDRMEAEGDDEEEEDDDELTLADLPVSSSIPQPQGTAIPTTRMDEFAALLRNAMTRANETEASEDAMSATVAAAETGNVAGLDLTAIIGDTLSSISKEAGLDVRGELSENPEQLRSILQGSIAELGTTLKEIDVSSAELYSQLGRLEQELRAETEAFEERKQLELSELLVDQNRLGRELRTSRENVQQSTEKLSALMRSYEEQADFITALALFPLKSVDKKVAFVVGLALALKVPYDAAMLFAVRGADASELMVLIAQAIIGFACLWHYGIIAAIGRKPMEI